MSNPISGAYIEAQDKKPPHRFQEEESSKKMGLEVIGTTAQAFAEALFDSAIQTPANGLIQLFNPQEARALKVVENKKQELNSPEWYGQLVGVGAGSILNYIGLSKALKNSCEAIKLAGSASSSKLWRPLANTVSLVENSALCKKPLLAAGTTGAIYGGILTPVDPKGEDMTIARLKNAGIGAVSVAAMITPNQIRLSRNGFRPGETGSKFHETIALAMGGPFAGLVHNEARSLCDGKLAPNIDSREFKESMLAYSILGAGYAAYHGMATAEKPMEVQDFESTDKLIQTRRPENSGPKRTREELGEITKKWNAFVKEFDSGMRQAIRETDISDTAKLELTRLHQLAMNEILSNPANVRKITPYHEHLQSMKELLKHTWKREKLAQSETKKALERWNAEHPDTPAQEGDLVAPNPLYPKWIQDMANENRQLPAVIQQESTKANLPATSEQLSKGQDQLPVPDEKQSLDQLPSYGGDESMAAQQMLEPKPADLVNQKMSKGSLRNGFLGTKIDDMRDAMSNPRSPYYAKRANIDSQRGSDGKQTDLAKTIYSNKSPDAKKKGGLSVRDTTFEKFGYTPEQANRKALVDKITHTSKDTSAGIGAPDELHKHKPEPWDSREEP